MNWLWLLVGLSGLGIGAFFVARNPKFWVGLAKTVFNELLPSFLKLFENRPKSDEEWKEWRELSAMKPSEMSAKQKERFKELKKLNAEFKK
jgi:hypothetical protein